MDISSIPKLEEGNGISVFHIARYGLEIKKKK